MKSRKGFTLIELLVVISIIAILAAILMPALGRARELAKAAACQSNEHNIGLALQMYAADNRGLFPVCYKYNNGDGAGIDAVTGIGGYFHWTAQIDPAEYTDPCVEVADPVNGPLLHYPRQADEFVCPSHMPGGFAPTDFTAGRIPSAPPGQGSLDPSLDDRQCPRISYIPNELIMPRKKFSSAHDNDPAGAPQGTGQSTHHLQQVSADIITAPQHTILIGEFSQSPNCILGGSVAGGTAYKSHRPTNAVFCTEYAGPNGNTHCFDGESYDKFILPAAESGALQYYKLTYDQAEWEISQVVNNPAAGASALYSHIAYTDDNAHKTGSNYLFVDGHVAKYTLDQTLDAGNWMWGDKIYSCVEQPVLQDPATSGPDVQGSTPP
jgi:prepilin-type N-terminal cleavage/methylation domain-containing protein/prepilin-type processing-associated H-X9-DG protein